MAHIHSVYDTDKHFTIEPGTRELVAHSPEKNCIMQYDHNSERITFDLPSVVEGHRIIDCNRVEVHYLNIDAKTKEQRPGLYEVDDLQVSQSDANVAVCSWLISENATQLVGPLYFRVTFKCVTSGNVDYSWSTAIYKGLVVSDGINCTEYIAEQYADVLERWRQELIALGGVTDEEIAAAVNDYLSENPINLDATLTQPGKAADAKAVGDALAELEAQIPESGGPADLTGYATEDWVREGYQPKGDYLTEVPAGYVTEQYVKEYSQPKGDYLTNEDKTELEQKLDNVSWNNLKDKPFGEETNVLYDNSEFWIDAEGYGFAEVGSNFLETGETYEVEFIGKQYTCVCTEQTYSNQVVRSIVGDDFIISQDDLGNDITVSCDAEVIYNVFVPLKISKVYIKQLESKYLPEQLQFGNEEPVVLYENPALYIDDMNESAWIYMEENILIPHEMYDITYNGESYAVMCEEHENSSEHGVLKFANVEIDMWHDGMRPATPFIFMVTDYDRCDENVSIKLSKLSTKKLDSKYLPDVSDIPASWIAALKTVLGI